jgi:hypothetical protein
MEALKELFFRSKKTNPENDEDGSDRIQKRSKILLWSKLSPDNKEIVKVFASMRADEITITASNDNLIKKYGELQLDRIGSERHHEVSQGMRQLARLLNQLNEVTDGASMTLADYLKPQHFDHIITATRQLCSFDKITEKSSKKVGVPSLALKLGYQIKKCIFVIQGTAFRRKDNSLLQDCEHLLKLFEGEWNDKISYHSLETLSKQKFNTLNLVPLTRDLVKLRGTLATKLKDLTADVKTNPTLDNWSQLAEVTLCRVIIFNKRRGGEASKLLLESFQNRPQWQQAADVVQSTLRPLEKELVKR